MFAGYEQLVVVSCGLDTRKYKRIIKEVFSDNDCDLCDL